MARQHNRSCDTCDSIPIISKQKSIDFWPRIPFRAANGLPGRHFVSSATAIKEHEWNFLASLERGRIALRSSPAIFHNVVEECQACASARLSISVRDVSRVFAREARHTGTRRRSLQSWQISGQLDLFSKTFPERKCQLSHS